ncbi:MAG: DUF262 domain-containing protein, partial [Actinobacteria bacterium]|nr:DUF262 domain-containing protein [Actinomycetota bacterium]
PFVWDSTKVRDLIDSLYRGYPIGYLILWRNPNVKLKDGKTAEGKKILIDGQQRVASLSTSVLGQNIINRNYEKEIIKIAFNPINEYFEVYNSAIAKDASWIPDISSILLKKTHLLKFIKEFVSKNENVSDDYLFEVLDKLLKITERQIGIIELDHDLDIETVTEIFIRINSKGVVLSQADFAMSKIAVDKKYGGETLRKCIDYFCHLAISPDFYSQLKELDNEFTKTIYFNKMSWLKNENDNLYDPDYTDLLRVAFTSEFNRGRLSDLVSLLSGRNFETRTYEEKISEESFKLLNKGILNYINENNFKKFVMIIKSAGFIVPELIRSQNALNFAYILYLKLKSRGYNQNDIEHFVRKWFVLSVLTGRYSGPTEATFDFDIKQISSRNFREFLKLTEDSDLSDAFWNVAMIENLDTSVISSPYFNVFLASQVKANDRGFLSEDITVKDLILHKGDIHHVYPKEYLKKFGIQKNSYNKIANYVYMQSEININISNRAPKKYFLEIIEQCNTGIKKYGGITDTKVLSRNLKTNCIPEIIFEGEINNYEDFLYKRRVLMAKKLKDYYFSL